MDTSSIRLPLDPAQMTDIYLELRETTGKSSVGRVAAWLAQVGIINQMTRRPYTRQAIHLVMLQDPRSKKVLPHRKKARSSA